MSDLRTAAQAALDALEPVALYRAYNGDDWPARQVRPVIAALRAALAAPQPQPQAGPVAVRYELRPGEYAFMEWKYHEANAATLAGKGRNPTPLYIAPQPQAEPVEITDAMVEAALKYWFGWRAYEYFSHGDDRKEMRAALEAAMGAK